MKFFAKMVTLPQAVYQIELIEWCPALQTEMVNLLIENLNYQVLVECEIMNLRLLSLQMETN